MESDIMLEVSMEKHTGHDIYGQEIFHQGLFQISVEAIVMQSMYKVDLSNNFSMESHVINL
jgi:hypothetical protein